MNYSCRLFPKTEQPLTVSVPGSKSITNRALLLSVLAGGGTLSGLQTSDDASVFVSAVRSLGYDVEIEGTNATIHGGERKKNASVYVGSAGTAARFLTAFLGLSDGTYEMDSSEQMRKRPMKPLLDSLVSLGAEVSYHGKEGHFPFTLKGGKKKNEVTVDVNASSQFLSALLIASPIFGGLTIHVEGEHGMAYVEMTVEMMKAYGVNVVREGKTFIVPSASYTPCDYEIEPDVSAACYFYALAALTKNTITVDRIVRPSLQGDLALLDVLKEMGAKVDGTSVTGDTLHGVTVDMSAFSDQAITLACVAPFATSPTTITGIGHIRLQESDRLTAMATELKKLGATVEYGEDYIKIYPSTLHGGVVATYDDHRMAMGFSLIGQMVEGVVIENAECCKKTFAQYFDVLDKLREQV